MLLFVIKFPALSTYSYAHSSLESITRITATESVPSGNELHLKNFKVKILNIFKPSPTEIKVNEEHHELEIKELQNKIELSREEIFFFITTEIANDNKNNNTINDKWAIQMKQLSQICQRIFDSIEDNSKCFLLSPSDDVSSAQDTINNLLDKEIIRYTNGIIIPTSQWEENRYTSVHSIAKKTKDTYLPRAELGIISSAVRYDLEEQNKSL